MKNKEIITIRKMIEYSNKALRYTQDCTFEDFSNDEEKIDATIFAISQIGELVKNITAETMQAHPEIEWVIIKNLRNKIVHDYEGINLNLIWDIISNDLGELNKKLIKIIEENENVENK